MESEQPGSYLTLAPGAEVRSSDGQTIGVVHHVLADEEDDIFDGIIVDLHRGPGGLHFVDAPLVAAIHESSVTLTVSAEEAERLPKPEPSPAVMEVHGAEDLESPLQHKLRRAWDIISGKG